MHNRVDDGAIEAVNLLVDFAPLDANRLGIGEMVKGGAGVRLKAGASGETVAKPAAYR
ncbi:hypothetical protein [Mesorhizobium sp. ESP6-5]|uniref:hypothetical protein n=1 Tax=Mesorhizobium sp. ESP6-5 TaxID=2876623 RepID=UPI001CCB57BA|nr:hypothetical protein [Mesorhizobium sp. ESP6-5]